ncbi:MAG: hypothetical protein JSV27_11645 [Candidatus Bathyarchaeota archaeon]|nr:MAG: hypothetical protein JSV27_11645 [Candidatus Bathyarchaeota archaeon]
MTWHILTILKNLYGPELNDEKIRETLSFPINKKLAQIGDSVLDLILLVSEYRNPSSEPKSMDDLRKKEGKKRTNQKLLKKDYELTQFLLNSDYEQNSQSIIGRERSDAYMEAIIGAIYLTKGLYEAKKFVKVVYGLNILE